MKFVVGDCMNVVLGDTQLSGNIMLCYLSVCHDHVMNLGNGLLCGDGDWPSSSSLSLPRLNSASHYIKGALSSSVTPSLHGSTGVLSP